MDPADQQQLCLKWNNHQSTLVSVFDMLLESGTLVDCTLAAQGEYLRAHKVVLSACSPFFELLLTQHDERHPIVILKDVTYQELKALVEYMYRGEASVPQDQFKGFLEAAESLQVKGLSESVGRVAGGTAKRKPSEGDSKLTPASRTLQLTPHIRGVSAELVRPDSADSAKDSRASLSKVPSREGSTSPVPRKRKKHHRRASSEDKAVESNVLQNSCNQTSSSSEQSTAVPSEIQGHTDGPRLVNLKASATHTPQLQPSELLDQEMAQTREPVTEVLLEAKTEFVEEMCNENIEILTLHDVLDVSFNDTQPGPSCGGERTSQGYPQCLVTDQSRDDVFETSQDAIGAQRHAKVALDKNGVSGVTGGEVSEVLPQYSLEVDEDATSTAQPEQVPPCAVSGNCDAVPFVPNHDLVQPAEQSSEQSKPSVLEVESAVSITLNGSASMGIANQQIPVQKLKATEVKSLVETSEQDVQGNCVTENLSSCVQSKLGYQENSSLTSDNDNSAFGATGSFETRNDNLGRAISPAQPQSGGGRKMTASICGSVGMTRESPSCSTGNAKSCGDTVASSEQQTQPLVLDVCIVKTEDKDNSQQTVGVGDVANKPSDSKLCRGLSCGMSVCHKVDRCHQFGGIYSSPLKESSINLGSWSSWGTGQFSKAAGSCMHVGGHSLEPQQFCSESSQAKWPGVFSGKTEAEVVFQGSWRSPECQKPKSSSDVGHPGSPCPNAARNKKKALQRFKQQQGVVQYNRSSCANPYVWKKNQQSMQNDIPAAGQSSLLSSSVLSKHGARGEHNDKPVAVADEQPFGIDHSSPGVAVSELLVAPRVPDSSAIKSLQPVFHPIQATVSQGSGSVRTNRSPNPFIIQQLQRAVPLSLRGQPVSPTNPPPVQMFQAARLESQISAASSFFFPEQQVENPELNNCQNSTQQSMRQHVNVQEQNFEEKPAIFGNRSVSVKREPLESDGEVLIEQIPERPRTQEDGVVPVQAETTGGLVNVENREEAFVGPQLHDSGMITAESINYGSSEDVKPTIQDLVPLLSQPFSSVPEAVGMKMELHGKETGSTSTLDDACKEVAHQKAETDGPSSPRVSVSNSIVGSTRSVADIGSKPGRGDGSNMHSDDEELVQELECHVRKESGSVLCVQVGDTRREQAHCGSGSGYGPYVCSDDMSVRELECHVRKERGSMSCVQVADTRRERAHCGSGSGQDAEACSAMDNGDVSIPQESPRQYNKENSRSLCSSPVAKAKNVLHRSGSLEDGFAEGASSGRDARRQQSKKRKSTPESRSDKRSDATQWLYCPRCRKKFMSGFNLFTHVQFFCQPTRKSYK